MRHRAFFRLAIKAVGLLLIGMNAPGVIDRVAYSTKWLLDTSNPRLSTLPLWLEMTLQILGPAIGTIFGIYLLLGGERVVRLVMPTATPHCGECGYDLTGLLGEQCPECGAAIHQDAEPKREITKEE